MPDLGSLEPLSRVPLLSRSAVTSVALSQLLQARSALCKETGRVQLEQPGARHVILRLVFSADAAVLRSFLARLPLACVLPPADASLRQIVAVRLSFALLLVGAPRLIFAAPRLAVFLLGDEPLRFSFVPPRTNAALRVSSPPLADVPLLIFSVLRRVVVHRPIFVVLRRAFVHPLIFVVLRHAFAVPQDASPHEASCYPVDNIVYHIIYFFLFLKLKKFLIIDPFHKWLLI